MELMIHLGGWSNKPFKLHITGRLVTQLPWVNSHRSTSLVFSTHDLLLPLNTFSLFFSMYCCHTLNWHLTCVLIVKFHFIFGFRITTLWISYWQRLMCMNFLLSSIVWEEGYSLPFAKVLVGDHRFSYFVNYSI